MRFNSACESSLDGSLLIGMVLGDECIGINFMKQVWDLRDQSRSLMGLECWQKKFSCWKGEVVNEGEAMFSLRLKIFFKFSDATWL